MLVRTHQIGCLLGLVLLARSSAHGADALRPTDYSDLEQQIRQGHAEEVLKLAQDAVKRDPESWQANALLSQALVELGRVDEAEAGLIRWADRDRADPTRVRRLMDLYRKTERWDSAVGLTTRIVALPEPERTKQLRSLVDTLCDAQDCHRAAGPVALLVPGMTDESREAVLRALDAATRRDVKGMLVEVPAFPMAATSSNTRRRALMLVSCRAADAIRTKRGKIAEDLPPTGGSSFEALTVKPEKVNHVEPIYPDVAKRAGIEGVVILRALILPSGEVIVTGVDSATNPMFIEAAAEAVSQWIFEPGGDKALGTDYLVKLQFRLK